MSEHIAVERMHDVLDGLVDAADEGRMEAHLRACDACRDAFAELSATIAEIRALPRSAGPPREVWSAVAARIRGTTPVAPEEPGSVLAFPSRRRAEGGRWIFSGRQLAAAAALVAMLSSTLTWSLLRVPATPGFEAPAPVAGFETGRAARAVSAGGAYDAAVAELETILAEGRELLAPETLLTIDASLRQIDEAMAEVRDALAEDPSSGILERMLSQHRRAKLRVLRQAASAVQASL